MRFRGRSYMAFVLTPELPIVEWLTELDGWIGRSAGFFVGRPVVLDLAGLDPDRVDIGRLIDDLQARGVRVMGIEGTDPERLGPGLPPVLRGGRAISPLEPVDKQKAEKPAAAAPAEPQPTSLLIESPVRSGQTVVFPNGDVTVLGSVASGAEVIAGGSIHVYGALRGRALAGSAGNPRARIFCGRIEAELLAIDGLYRTADEMEPGLRSRPVQAWLEGDVMKIAPLD
ncbi:MAG TPA: septum site-determining protein MinC [Xanthobacteraceae bacterium]|nr:septum site-determining protein MinC [Xanthobacteraceae bacterium]